MPFELARGDSDCERARKFGRNAEESREEDEKSGEEKFAKNENSWGMLPRDGVVTESFETFRAPEVLEKKEIIKEDSLTRCSSGKALFERDRRIGEYHVPPR